MNKNYRFMPKGKKQNNQFSSVTPSSIVEFQEPKEEKINLTTLEFDLLLYLVNNKNKPLYLEFIIKYK